MDLQVSDDGRYLVFQSGADITGYDSGGANEAYLFDSDSGAAGATTCISCRQDGLPSLVPDGTVYDVVASGYALNNLFHQPHSLVVRNGSPEVLFSSIDVLASGAVAGQNNIYEWVHDQVFRLTSAPEGTQAAIGADQNAVFAGASADGTDVYLSSPENLSWEDQDDRNSIFDARIGGGFPELTAPPAPCDATVEGSCQGFGLIGTVVPGAGTEVFSGPGSPQQQPQQPKQQQKTKRTKKHKKKGKKKVRKRKSGKSKRKPARQANGNRRAGK